jgi:hypothetical protein
MEKKKRWKMVVPRLKVVLLLHLLVQRLRLRAIERRCVPLASCVVVVVVVVVAAPRYGSSPDER